MLVKPGQFAHFRVEILTISTSSGVLMKLHIALIRLSAGLLAAFSIEFSIVAHAATPVVTTQTLKKIEVSDGLNYPARMESNVNASIYADADGVVTKIKKSLGQKVKKGNAILTIEHTDPIYQYAPMVMTTPVSGVVSTVKVTEGSRVSKGELVATVTDPEKIRVLIEVAAQDLKSFKPGLQGEFEISGRAKPVAVKVRGVSPFVDPGTGTASAELEIVKSGDKDLLLTPGLVGKVNFKVNRHEAIVIPEYALVYKGNDTFVRIVDGGKAKKVPVKIGTKQRGNVEITEGLKPGDVMIERASGFVSEGEEVKVENAKADETATAKAGDSQRE
jgi:multidrug efflux pump subunit AcrA (membrane-fusion protein)